MTPGKLITFEGVEGAGKTTQLARAADFLKSRGFDVAAAREPGGTAVGERIRDVLLHRAEAPLTPPAETFLYLAARSQLVAEVVAPALAAGKIVLLDRYVHSTLAYQGYGLGVELGGASVSENIRRLRELCRAAAKGAWPDLVFILDLPAEAGAARNAAKAPDRIEARDASFHQRVREGFLALAAEEPDIVRVVGAGGPRDEVFAEISTLLSSFLEV